MPVGFQKRSTFTNFQSVLLLLLLLLLQWCMRCKKIYLNLLEVALNLLELVYMLFTMAVVSQLS